MEEMQSDREEKETILRTALAVEVADWFGPIAVSCGKKSRRSGLEK